MQHKRLYPISKVNVAAGEMAAAGDPSGEWNRAFSMVSVLSLAVHPILASPQRPLERSIQWGAGGKTVSPFEGTSASLGEDDEGADELSG